MRRQPCPFGADGIFHDLHHQAITLMEDALDRQRTRSGYLSGRLPDIGHMQERRALQANIDKRRLHSRQDSGDAPEANVTHQTTPARTFNVEFLQRSVLDDANAHFLRHDIDQDRFRHGLKTYLGSAPALCSNRDASYRGKPMIPVSLPSIRRMNAPAPPWTA